MSKDIKTPHWTSVNGKTALVYYDGRCKATLTENGEVDGLKQYSVHFDDPDAKFKDKILKAHTEEAAKLEVIKEADINLDAKLMDAIHFIDVCNDDRFVLQDLKWEIANKDKK